MQLLRSLQAFIAAEDGQDMIEYAMMAGFVALGAAAVMPAIATSVSTVFSQIGSVVTAAAS